MFHLSILSLLLAPHLFASDCGLELSEKNYQANAARVVALVQPTLTNAVNDCFNPDNPKYIKGTSDILQEVKASLSEHSRGLRTALIQYYTQVKMAKLKALAAANKASGQAGDVDAIVMLDADVKAGAGAMLGKVNSTDPELDRLIKKVKDQESNLTKYGFVISDKKDGANYRYPNCNSQKNDHPEEVWRNFRSVLYALPSDLGKLRAAVTCQQSAVGGVEALLKNAAGFGLIK